MKLVIPRYDEFRIQKILIYLSVILFVTPYLCDKYLLAACIVGALFIFTTLYSFSFCALNTRLFRCISILFFIEILYRVIGLSTADVGNYGKKFLVFSAVWMGCFIHYYFSNKEKKNIIIFMNVIIYINIIYNIYIYAVHPELSGLSTTTQSFLTTYSDWNIATTAFYYLVEFQAAYFLCKSILFQYKRRQSLVLCMFSSLFIILYSGSGTIVITYLLFCIFAIFLGRRTNASNKIFSILFIIIVGIILLIIAVSHSDEIHNFLVPITGEKIAIRIDVILRLISRNSIQNDSEYLARFSFMQLDLKTWFSNLKNVLIGNGYHTRDTLSVLTDASVNGDGGHSMLIDLLARYGMIGLAFDIVFIRNSYRFIEIDLSSDSRLIMYGVVTLFLINNLLNNCNGPAICFLMIVFFSCIFSNDSNYYLPEEEEI